MISKLEVAIKSGLRAFVPVVVAFITLWNEGKLNSWDAIKAGFLGIVVKAIISGLTASDVTIKPKGG